MTTYLLDANVLIALTIHEHEHHERASVWARTIERWAVCPVVEGALLRFLLSIGEGMTGAMQMLRAVRAVPGCEFWPEELSYVDVEVRHVQGHRQVTDAYLASLAARRPDATLATLDEALSRSRPDAVFAVPPL